MGGIESAPPQAFSENEKSPTGTAARQDASTKVEKRRDVEQGGPNKDDPEGQGAQEAYLVTFHPGDSEDPKNWSRGLKWGVTLALSATGFNRIMVSTMMAPAINTIAVDLYMSTTESTMALSVYLLATAFGPLIIGPLSEVYGRKPIVHITNVWFLAWNLICGFANSKGLLIASRLLAGFGASAVYTLGYGVLGDVWPPEQRGRSLSLYLLIPLTGAAVGPIIGGFIVQYSSTWRWMFWSTSILQGVLEICSLPIVRETYAPLLLRRRAQKFRKGTNDMRYHAPIELHEANRSTTWKLRNSLSRPLRLLAFHPIIQVQALLGGINYGLLYFALASFSTLYTTAYRTSISISGLHYIALCLGEILGSQLCGPLMDYVYKSLTIRAGGTATPELRIPLLLPGVLFTPAGLLLYGWAAQYRLPWPAVDTGAALLSLGMQVFDTTLRAYVMDAYPEHVSSASAATQLLRSLMAFGFPLFAHRMYEVLGYGWGNSLLAFLSFGIALPATGILWRWGARLRGRGGASY
ncbi:MAG: MFS siderochrome iron transporter 1 [Chrysothrix sp. TS-e1954]|nr:MAG: MFS siderochrome iron transporter 1 [Chrysothrix sp. TS-e1954]